MYFDSHAHYDDRRFNKDRAALLETELPNSGVVGIVNIGACMKTSVASVALAEKYPFIYAAVGVHPHNASQLKAADLETLRKLAAKPKTVAIGEIGLDFHYDHSPRDVQRHWFAQQLALAEQLDMPVVIHSREAAQETMAIIKESNVRNGVIHCYSGHLPMALEYIEMGFYIGLGGVVTYKNAEKTREVAKQIPLERLLIETDAPYLAPVPFRGERNDSAKLAAVVETIATLRDISQKAVSEATTANVKQLFSI
ncbi:MAG: TatD family hydrolase [Defluviitaleaceae bacterium]|nr:TatD family hydrolase [Defluviitaleaceae bacterium]